MANEPDRRTFTGTATRRIMGAAVAAGTAISLGVVGAPTNAAAPPPDLCSYASPGDDSGTEVDAIRQLKANYFANIDAKNWSALRELLAPNITVDTTCSAGPIFFNRDSFVAFLQLTLGGAQTHHRGYDPYIKLTSPTPAEGLWTLEDVLVFGGTLGVHGYGHYTDRYEKVNGTWVETYSKLTRTRIDITTPDGATVLQANVPPDQVAAKVKAVTGR
jgi:hypothetical protein